MPAQDHDDAAFRGFTPAAFEFLASLEADNSRTFFEAHRTVYETCLREPMRALVVSLGIELQKRISPAIRADPRIGKSLFRIHRDLRFSRDKTPYNSWLDAIFWEGGEDARRVPGLLLRIGPDYVVVGCGVLGMSDALLTRYRTAVDDEVSGPALVTVLEQIRRSRPRAEISNPTRKTVPAGFRPDHPRAELLRLESVYASERRPLTASSRSSAFVAWLGERYEVFAPLHRWLVAVLADDG